MSLSSPFDVSFAGSLNLCVPVNDAVLVSFGTAIFDYAKGSFWAGYIKAPGSSLEAQAECQTIVDVEAKARWKKSQSGDPYYKWGWNKDSLDGKAIPPEPTPQSIADLLLKMRGDFQAQERRLTKMRRRIS